MKGAGTALNIEKKSQKIRRGWKKRNQSCENRRTDQDHHSAPSQQHPKGRDRRVVGEEGGERKVTVIPFICVAEGGGGVRGGARKWEISTNTQPKKNEDQRKGGGIH